MIRNSLLVLTLSCALTGCVVQQTVELTPLEIQNLQTRSFESGYDVVFASVISVLQDLGYVVNSADRGTGFIAAESPARGGSKFVLFEGFVATTSQTAATAFIEKIGDEARVRLNFVERSSSSTEYGQSGRHDRPILDAGVYANAFERVANAIFFRENSS